MGESFDYDVFLCFADDDEPIARPIHRELCQSGLRVFWSDATMKEKIGQSWLEAVQSALERSQHFLLIASRASMQSQWVKREYEAFLAHCNNKDLRRLIPLLTKGYAAASLPLFLRNLEAAQLENPDSVKQVIHLLGGTPINDLKTQLEAQTKKYDKLNKVTDIGVIVLTVALILLGFLFGLSLSLHNRQIASHPAQPPSTQQGTNQVHPRAELVIAIFHALIILLFIALQFTNFGGKAHNWEKYGWTTGQTMKQFWRGWRWIWLTWLALYVWLSVCWLQPEWYDQHMILTWSVADSLNIANAFGFFFCFLALDEPSVPTAEEPNRAKGFHRHLLIIFGVGILIGVISVMGRVLNGSADPTHFGALGPVLSSCYTGLAMAYLFGRLDSHHMKIPRILLAPLYLYVIIQLAWVIFQAQPPDSVVPSMFFGAALILKILLFAVVTYWLDRGVLLDYLRQSEEYFVNVRSMESDGPTANGMGERLR
jgi:hypothetical protein